MAHPNFPWKDSVHIISVLGKVLLVRVSAAKCGVRAVPWFNVDAFCELPANLLVMVSNGDIAASGYWNDLLRAVRCVHDGTYSDSARR